MAMYNNVAGVPVLNEDCFRETLDHTGIQQVLRYREVSPQFRDVVNKYLQGVYGYVMFMPGSELVVADKKSRVLKLRDARHIRVMLQSFDTYLIRLTTNADNQWLAEMSGNCRYLREITLYHIFWRKELLEFLRSCQQLEKVTLRGALVVEDDFTANLNKLNHIEVDRNERITGSFLDHLQAPLESLCLRECSSLQGYHLERCLSNIKSLTRLELDECPLDVLASAPNLLRGLPLLRILSLSHYTEARGQVYGLAESISSLADLRELRLRRNDAVNDDFLRVLARGCHRLDTLEVSRCNGSGFFKGVTDAGLAALIQGRPLAVLDISFLESLTEQGFAAVQACRPLQTLRATHINQIEDETVFYDCWKHCENLQVLDLRGCDAVSNALVQTIAAEVVKSHRGPLTLLVAGTSFQQDELMRWPKELTVSVEWPLEEPWERFYHNPDPQQQVLDDYGDMDFGY